MHRQHRWTVRRGQPRAGRDPFERGFAARCLFALVAMLGAASIGAAPLHLPALFEPPTTEHHAGKVVFLELVTPDLAAAEHFYGGLLGWTFRDVQSGSTSYAQASLDGHSVAGIIQRPPPADGHRRPAWLGFIAVGDVDAAEKNALKHGAKTLFAPHTIPDRGREAVIADPQGAVFAILASSTGDSPDELAAPGDWIWSSLITSDPDAAAAFYQALFDYDVYELPADEGTRHLMFASGDDARASANSLPAGAPDAHPHWISYVRVDDAVATAARATGLGGHVLVEPRTDRHGGKIAVLADPQGAVFGLLEWPVGDSKEMSR